MHTKSLDSKELYKGIVISTKEQTHALDWCFSKYGPRPAASASPGQTCELPGSTPDRSRRALQ